MTRLLALLALAALGAPVAAQDANALALSARKVLKRHCLSCHKGEGSESGYRFNSLDHASMLKDFDADEKAVVAPKKLDSRLWVRAGVEKTMPPRSVKERPSAEELETLKKWIEAGAPAFPAPKNRDFITNAAVLAAILAHLNAAEAADLPYIRFFTLAHLHNNPAVSDEDLRVARAAMSKAANSLSRSPRVTPPKAIDKGETIFAFDLRSYDWHEDNAAAWRAALREYPYGIDYKGSADPALIQLQKNLDRLTKGELVYVRADWFVATATRPPLYYDMLQLPKTVHELRKWLKVDRDANFLNDKLWRAGFQSSGVSAQNRLVERHDSPVGVYYWESYDFKPRKAHANLTRFPLGPEFPGNPFPKQAFQHDGGEMIFGLPNGLQGYYLADGKGGRIDEGPTDVVSDALKTSGSPAIVNGTSCMHCHKFGILPVADTIRTGHGLFGDAQEKVRRLYPDRKVMDELVKGDEERFVAGLKKATGPFLNVAEDKDRPFREFGEPVGEVTRAYLLAEVTIEKAAYELGIDKPDVLAGMIQGNQKLKELGLVPLATGTGLKRDDWEARDGTSLYQDVARNLGIGTPLTYR